MPTPAALYAPGCAVPARAGDSLGYLVESYMPALIAQIKDCDRRFEAIATWQMGGDSNE